MGGGGLGKIEYSHVHSDGTTHPTRLETPPASVVCTSTPGVYSPDIKVQCLNCQAVLQPTDRIEVGQPKTE